MYFEYFERVNFQWANWQRNASIYVRGIRGQDDRTSNSTNDVHAAHWLTKLFFFVFLHLGCVGSCYLDAASRYWWRFCAFHFRFLFSNFFFVRLIRQANNDYCKIPLHSSEHKLTNRSTLDGVISNHTMIERAQQHF